MKTALIILFAIQGFGVDDHRVAIYDTPSDCKSALSDMRMSGDSHRHWHHHSGTQMVAYCAAVDAIAGDEPVSLMDKLRRARAK